jgi:hypothetical protein
MINPRCLSESSEKLFISLAPESRYIYLAANEKHCGLLNSFCVGWLQSKASASPVSRFPLSVGIFYQSLNRTLAYFAFFRGEWSRVYLISPTRAIIPSSAELQSLNRERRQLQNTSSCELTMQYVVDQDLGLVKLNSINKMVFQTVPLP